MTVPPTYTTIFEDTHYNLFFENARRRQSIIIRGKSSKATVDLDWIDFQKDPGETTANSVRLFDFLPNLLAFEFEAQKSSRQI